MLTPEVLPLLEELRSEEASTVILHNNNPDFDGPNAIVECNADWTGFNDERFSGDSVLEALQKAVNTKIQRRITKMFPAFVPDPLDEAIKGIRDSLTMMMVYAIPLVEDGVVVGYQIRTGALHRIFGILGGIGRAVTLPIVQAPAQAPAFPRAPGDDDGQG